MIVAIIQARMGSSRFPGKVLELVTAHQTMLEVLLARLNCVKSIDQIVVATTKNKSDDVIEELVCSLGYTCFRGSETNVLERFWFASRLVKAKVVIRITADCPLLDPWLLQEALGVFQAAHVDYLSNCHPPTFPDGLDFEIFTIECLHRTYLEDTSPKGREHVTSYMAESNKFLVQNFAHHKNLAGLRWTVDEKVDLHVVRKIFKKFAPDILFEWGDAYDVIQSSPEILRANSHLKRNEGSRLSNGQKLWRRAKRVIAGGNMLLSKRPDMFLPEKWPTYYAKASGCNVTDLDGRTYIDISSMGVGTNILGYNHPVITNAVVDSISKGNMSTLNAPEEVYLAERLVALNPWADMVKFARSGGEANAIAVRLGRAVSGKDGVAVCGYHGWHDWYLSANLNNDRSLDGHLLPGLQPLGVPRVLSNTVHTFPYNQIAALEAIISTKEIGVIKMEVQRTSPPLPGFLESVRKLADQNGIVLIFDECTSGFRETSCGLHAKYGVEPDVAVYGKALGNGHAITAIVGKKNIMEAAQSTFISSTFWTERSGSAAALSTLDVMEKETSWEVITEIGRNIRSGWQNLSDKYNLPINHSGIDALAGYSFDLPGNDTYQTFITDYMLSRGYLAGSSVYPCIFHTRTIIDSYLNILDEAFDQIAGSLRDETPAESFYRGTVRTVGFKRLN